jgi:membrane-bound lytic murein transglycosylase D
MPAVPRASEADFRLQRAEQRFQAGKIAFQEGRVEDARREFDSAVDILLTTPPDFPERARLEKRLEQMIETIYRTDLSLASAARESEDKVTFDKSPIDELLELTFPVDPNMRKKANREVATTASQLPLEINDIVLSYLNFFSSERGQRRILYGLQRSGRYRDMIMRVLAEEGVPQELIFLAQAESAFLPRAVSLKAATGMWQFVRDRGREYGLQQTPFTDERLDPEKATRAAARHLKDLYNQFGDWYLAMAAYNCGPGCVDKAVQRTGYADYWQLVKLGALPRETSNYVPLIVAMTIAAKNPKDYGLDQVRYDDPLEYENVELESPTNLALVADATGSSVDRLRELNPALLKSVAPAGYQLHIPKGTTTEVAKAFDLVPPANRLAWRLHRVSSGDTMASIAKRYGSVPASISAANGDSALGSAEWIAVPVAVKAEVPARKAGHKSAAVSAKSWSKKGSTKAQASRASSKGTVRKVSAPAPKRGHGKTVLAAGLH